MCSNHYSHIPSRRHREEIKGTSCFSSSFRSFRSFSLLYWHSLRVKTVLWPQKAKFSNTAFFLQGQMNGYARSRARVHTHTRTIYAVFLQHFQFFVFHYIVFILFTNSLMNSTHCIQDPVKKISKSIYAQVPSIAFAYNIHLTSRIFKSSLGISGYVNTYYTLLCW